MIVFLILTLHSKKFGDTCGASDFPLSAIKFRYALIQLRVIPALTQFLPSVPPLIIETFFFVLTAVKFHQSLKEGYGHIGVISKFMRDGLWAFALPLSAFTGSSKCSTELKENFSSHTYDQFVFLFPLGRSYLSGRCYVRLCIFGYECF